ncbi:MAG: hypothetical protein AABX28_03435 [Nanoarchaeota archaeon]
MQENVLRNELIRLRSLADLVDIYDLIRVDSNEERLRGVDGIYLFGETSDNEEASFISARKLLDKGLTKCVLIDDMPEQNGFPGFSPWSERLLNDYGISPQALEIDTSKGYHTLAEAESLVRYFSKENLNSSYIVASQFHLLRAFMTSSSVVIRENPELNFFACPGAEQDWNEVVMHSQGTTFGRRIDLIRGEVERIQKYTIKGDIESTKRILDYMVNRK